VKVDFYCIKDIIYFGEMTFYPEADFGRFNSESLEKEMGSWIELPMK